MSVANPVRVLSIAGSDSGGGAGIQADIRTIAALGGHSLTAITAITAQNTLGVHAQNAVDSELIRMQIDAVVEDIGVDAVKIGMLPTPESVMTVAQAIKRHKLKNIVLDPVLCASTGYALTTVQAQQALKNDLLPLVQLVTPNLNECSCYLNRVINARTQMPDAARAWLSQGCGAVLVKGGHLTTSELADYFLDEHQHEQWFVHSRIDSRNLHGTGCTLSSAIATELAKGHDMVAAIKTAIQFVQNAISRAQQETLGKGQGSLRQ